MSGMSLLPGEVMEVMGRGEWVYELTGTENGAEIKIYNLDKTGRMRWYMVTTVGSQYGAPIIVQEPGLGTHLSKIGVPDIDDCLVGFIRLDSDGKVAERKSFSNVVFKEGRTLDVTAKGGLVINGEVIGYLAAIFLPDKNRMKGYVGIFVPEKPGFVKTLEMEDVAIEAARELMP